MIVYNNEIKFNNETIKNAIMDALDKIERGIEVDEVDRNELINVILKGDRDFGIKNKDTGKDYTEEELQYSIYIHINEVDENNNCYIGRTSLKPERRWRSNGDGYKECQRMYDAIKKYGWDNFSHVVLCYGLSKEEADEMEIKLISIFKTTNEKFSYNIQNGGDGVGKHSIETRNKISEVTKGKKRSIETRNKISEVTKGGNNPKAKRVYCNGVIFQTAKECSEYYNVNYGTMKFWLQGRRKTPSEFIELGLRYATIEDINTYPLYIEEEH